MKSLREVYVGPACCAGPLERLGLTETVKKSTLTYANEHRPWELYQTVFKQLLGKCRAEAARQSYKSGLGASNFDRSPRRS